MSTTRSSPGLSNLTNLGAAREQSTLQTRRVEPSANRGLRLFARQPHVRGLEPTEAKCRRLPEHREDRRRDGAAVGSDAAGADECGLNFICGARPASWSLCSARTPVRSGRSRWRVPGGRRHVDVHYDASCTIPAGGCTTAASILVEVLVGDGALVEARAHPALPLPAPLPAWAKDAAPSTRRRRRVK